MSTWKRRAKARLLHLTPLLIPLGIGILFTLISLSLPVSPLGNVTAVIGGFCLAVGGLMAIAWSRMSLPDVDDEDRPPPASRSPFGGTPQPSREAVATWKRPSVGQVLGTEHDGGIVIRILAMEERRLDAEVLYVGAVWSDPRRMGNRILKVGQKVGLRLSSEQYGWWAFEDEDELPWFVLYYDDHGHHFEHYR